MIDISKSPMEVAPTAHYSMGGIQVNSINHSTMVKGLFAAGEVAGGLHGANRLGGNSLLDLVVFGRAAGRHINQNAKEASSLNISKSNIEESLNVFNKIQSTKKAKQYLILDQRCKT